MAERDDVNYRLERFKLDVPKNRRLDVDLARSITDGYVEMTIEGATTLSVDIEDPDYAILNSATLFGWTWGETRLGDPVSDPDGLVANEEGWIKNGHDVYVTVDDLDFALVKVAKAGTRLTLTFEDKIVDQLKRKRGARKARRSKVARAEFIKMLVREVRPPIPLHIPELHVRQPIEGRRQRVRARARAEDGGGGIPRRSGLTVKGVRATPYQIRNAERALDVAESLNAPKRARIALIAAMIVEALLRNPTGGDADSVGPLQVRAMHGPVSKRRDIEWCAHRFLTTGFFGNGGAIELARRNSNWSPGQIAQAVQGSMYPSRYDEYRQEAERFVNAYQGGGLGGVGGDTRPYEFARGKNENSWDAVGRLAQEVNWRRFVRKGRLWYVSEAYLFRQKPVLVVREGVDGVDWIDFDVDMHSRRLVAECRVQARADRWAALPGMVALVRDAGPATGRWLVSSIRKSLFDDAVEVTLRKPVPPKPEPAPEAARSSGGRSSGGRRRVGNDAVQRAYAAAERITRQRLPYVWGGGHARAGTPSGGGYDCSGAVGAVLAAARLGFKPGDPVPSSGVMAQSWGRPGKGKYLTMYANAGHVFLVFDMPGEGPRHFGTGDWGKGWRGGGFNPRMHPTDGFVARHWPGT